MTDKGVFMHNLQNPAFQEYLIRLRNLREKNRNAYKVPGEDDYIFKDGSPGVGSHDTRPYVQQLKECGIVDARKDLELSDLLNLNTNRFGGDRCKKDYECSSNKCIGTNLLRTKWGVCKKAKDDDEVFEELKKQNIYPPDITAYCKVGSSADGNRDLGYQGEEGNKGVQRQDGIRDLGYHDQGEEGNKGVQRQDGIRDLGYQGEEGNKGDQGNVSDGDSKVYGGGNKRRKRRTRKQKKSRYHRKSRRGKRRKTSKKTKHNRRRKNKSVRRR